MFNFLFSYFSCPAASAAWTKQCPKSLDISVIQTAHPNVRSVLRSDAPNARRSSIVRSRLAGVGRAVLSDVGIPTRFVYFPTEGFISLVTPLTADRF